MRKNLRILGLDPGLISTGWGIVDVTGSRLTHVAHGECASGSGRLELRLRRIFAALSEVVTNYQPHEAAAESSFVSVNAKTSLLLGHARGVAMLVPALAEIEVSEYAPTVVKRTIVGSGRADKDQVGYMVRFLFPELSELGNHAADALAVAVCHAHHRGSVAGRKRPRRGRAPFASGAKL